MRNRIYIIFLIVLSSLSIVACGSPPPPTEWTRCASPENTFTVDCPINAVFPKNDRSEDVLAFNTPKVILPQGKIEGTFGPITFIDINAKNSIRLTGYPIPADIDRSDLVAVITAIRDHDFKMATDFEKESYEIEPPQLKSFNGYPGAIAIYGRIDPDHRVLGRIEHIIYNVVIAHENKIIFAHFESRKRDGGELLPYYAEDVLDSIELHF